jgi:hypothetical protein
MACWFTLTYVHTYINIIHQDANSETTNVELCKKILMYVKFTDS